MFVNRPISRLSPTTREISNYKYFIRMDSSTVHILLKHSVVHDRAEWTINRVDQKKWKKCLAPYMTKEQALRSHR